VCDPLPPSSSRKRKQATDTETLLVHIIAKQAETPLENTFLQLHTSIYLSTESFTPTAKALTHGARSTNWPPRGRGNTVTR